MLVSRVRNSAIQGGEVVEMTRTSKNHGDFRPTVRFALALACSAWLAGRNAMAEPPSLVKPATPSAAPSEATFAQSTDPQAATPEPGTTQESKAQTDAYAQRHWQSGMAYLDEGEYAKALEAFTKAYELSERPSLLRSIAVAHEKLGDLPNALAAVDLYLRQVPNAADINDVQTYRAELQARHDQEQRAAETAAAAAKQADQDANRVTKPRVPDTYVLAQPAEPLPALVSDTDTRSVVMWSALGVGLAASASAGITGMLAQEKFDALENSCANHCTRERTHPGRTLALASTVLTALAVLSGGAAVVAWLDDSEQATGTTATSEASSMQPKLDAAYNDNRFMTHAKWRF